LCDGFKVCLEKKQSLVFFNEYKVKETPEFCIKPYTAKICWVYLSSSKDWESSLPRFEKYITFIRLYIKYLGKFPNIGTFIDGGHVVGIDRADGDLLAELCHWTFDHINSDLETFFAASSSTIKK